MSRSNPNIKNPATRFFKWGGGEEGGGKISYYDKAQEKEIEVKTPFTFLVLDDTLSTVSGFNKSEKSSFWSNEVRNITNDILTVKTGSGIKGRGKWAQLKGDLTGAKYAKSLYIAFKDETGEMAIGNIKIMGAALTQWIEFTKKFDVNQIAIIMDVNPNLQKNGSTKYYIPTFEALEVSTESNNEAVKLDSDLQAYFKSYFARDPEELSDEELDAAVDKRVEIEDVEVKDGKTVPAAPAEPLAAKADDDTIPVKNVPF